MRARAIVLLGLVIWPASLPAAADPALKDIARLADSVRSASFPQLKDVAITVEDLHSDYIFLETRFTMRSYLFGGRLRYTIFFNREALRREVPAEGLRAIMAHELSHVDYFESQSRMGLAGLVRLLSPSFTARFERNADLETIRLGYGTGLVVFRRWLYRNIPGDRVAGKKRDYFSPEEIEAVLQAEQEQPGVMKAFARCVPRNLDEIKTLAGKPDMACAVSR